MRERSYHTHTCNAHIHTHIHAHTHTHAFPIIHHLHYCFLLSVLYSFFGGNFTTSIQLFVHKSLSITRKLLFLSLYFSLCSADSSSSLSLSLSLSLYSSPLSHQISLFLSHSPSFPSPSFSPTLSLST